MSKYESFWCSGFQWMSLWRSDKFLLLLSVFTNLSVFIYLFDLFISFISLFYTNSFKHFLIYLLIRYFDLFPFFQDTQSFLLQFQAETPVKRGKLSAQDTKLAHRVLAQVWSDSFHYLFNNSMVHVALSLP